MTVEVGWQVERHEPVGDDDVEGLEVPYQPAASCEIIQFLLSQTEERDDLIFIVNNNTSMFKLITNFLAARSRYGPSIDIVMSLPLESLLRCIELEDSLDEFVGFKLPVSLRGIFDLKLLCKHKVRLCVAPLDKRLQKFFVRTGLD